MAPRRQKNVHVWWKEKTQFKPSAGGKRLVKCDFFLFWHGSFVLYADYVINTFVLKLGICANTKSYNVYWWWSNVFRVRLLLLQNRIFCRIVSKGNRHFIHCCLLLRRCHLDPYAPTQYNAHKKMLQFRQFAVEFQWTVRRSSSTVGKCQIERTETVIKYGFYFA